MSELFYRIDPKESKFLRLHLEEHHALRKRILYLSTLKEIARAEDLEALNLLSKAKLRACSGQSLETLSFQQIDLDPPQAADVLRHLIKTKRLFCGSAPIQSLSEGSVHWVGEALSEQSCRIEAFLWAGRKIPLKECRWILYAKTVSAVFGEELIVAANAGGGKWLEQAAAGPIVLEGSQRRKFFDDELPVQWKKKEEAPLSVLPQLLLHDGTGCFADLWMDYSHVGRLAANDPAPLIGGRKRLLDAEKAWEKDLLEAGYLRKQVGRSFYYCPGDLAAEALSLLLDVGWQVFDAAGKPVERFGDWTCEIAERENSIVLRADERTRRALLAVKEGRAWIDLGEKSAWIDRKEALKLFGGILEGDFADEEIRIPKQRLSACLPLLDGKRIGWAAHLKEAANRLSTRDNLERTLPGESFRGTLLGYQQEGLDWLSFIHRFGFGGMLADEMGLGKTVQLLAFFSRLRTNLPTLIVVPTSLLYNWRAEFGRFLPAAAVKIHAGAERAEHAAELQAAPYILTSYAILRQDEALLRQIELEALVFDESSAIKNFGTRTAQAALSLQAKVRFCISGTPIENRTQELAAQFSVLMPQLVSPSDSPEAMQRKTRPFLLRRLKSQVEIELPEKIDQIAWVEMNASQESVYQEFHKSALKRLKPLIAQDGASAHRMEILEAILRLRQICCDPRLVGADGEGAKLEQALLDVEGLMADGRKILLYSQFTSMLDLIEQAAQNRGWRILRIDGSTPAIERGDAVKRFQEEEGSVLFLLSLKAGGVGLNLTAADYVLLFDPWWNEAVERQAIDRAHRIGRTNTVFVKRYLIPQSIEEKMLSLKGAKQAVADRILDLEAVGSDWSADEWLELLDF